MRETTQTTTLKMVIVKRLPEKRVAKDMKYRLSKAASLAFVTLLINDPHVSFILRRPRTGQYKSSKSITDQMNVRSSKIPPLTF